MRVNFNRLAAFCLMLCLPVFAATGLGAAAPATRSVTGEVKSISLKSKVLAVQLEGKEVRLFTYTADTRLVNAKADRDFQPGDRVAVEYHDDNGTHVSAAITRLVAVLPRGVSPITTSELEALVAIGPAAGNYLLIDARSAAKYKAGHIRTAVSIPYSELLANPAGLLPADRNKPLIFYCDGSTCNLSAKSAELAVQQGYKNVRLYPEGEPGWKKSEYCTATSVDHIQTGNLVLIDLRQPDRVSEGHIPGAVNIPLKQLPDTEKQFPEYKGASIVFYGDAVSDLREAISTVRDWGYTNASAFVGGIGEWRARGLSLAKGPAAARISYQRQLTSEDQVGAAELRKILAAGNHLLVDVRNKEEFEKGHLPGALNIPIDEIVRRVPELASRKEPLLIYCATGTRSEMAYDILKQRGVRAKQVQATIDFPKQGGYTITE